ncbi:hypothetical protein Pcinc_010413 [Petrolisthes cinctipes]|uniref:Peptidase S1 domain-containing protein n=1 Tax=Petrolisthes cinctipes TaxID=88211 RepID=A0AAE1G5F5_PETCI|nr:hypothetical protein Pcinc_010413 [Petrolisthes cinctipes]
MTAGTEAPPRRKPYLIGSGDEYTTVHSGTSGKARFRWAFKATGDCEVISLTCGTNSFSSPRKCQATMRFLFKEGGTTQRQASSSFKVGVGSTDITSSTTRIDVSSITVHEGYNRNTLENDIAVLELSSPLTFSDTVMPVCAPDTTNNFVGETATATGWGTLQSEYVDWINNSVSSGKQMCV